MKKIQDIDVKNKKVLVRVDFNVPMKAGHATDIGRIKACKETVEYITKNGGVAVLCTHLGRPEGKKVREFSLKPLVLELEKVLEEKVKFVPDSVGRLRDDAVRTSKPGNVLLLENLRFHAEEEENNAGYAKKLTVGCTLFVNDAFSASHRAHASIVGVTDYLPAAAGFSMQNEIKNLSELLKIPKKPYVAVIGGAKISDKIEVLKNLIEKVDVLIIGGAMANTFLAAEGYEMGKSLFEEDFENSADEIISSAETHGVELILPDDVMVTKKIAEGARSTVRALDEIEKSDIIVDVGPRSVGKFAEPLKFAGTIFWNGPVGVSEYKNFAGGTIGVAKIISESAARSVIGGGDTIAAVSDLELNFNFVSTGGGATLEYLSGKELPGIKALSESRHSQ